MVYKLRGVVFTTTGMMQRATTVSFKFNSKLFWGKHLRASIGFHVNILDSCLGRFITKCALLFW